MLARHESHLDHLPEQPEHEVRPPLDHVLRADVDHLEADRLGRVDHQVLVLAHLERVARAEVEHALVDGVGRRHVDHLGEQHTVRDRAEELIRVRDGQQVLQLRVPAELAVHEVGEGQHLLLGEAVDRAVALGGSGRLHHLRRLHALGRPAHSRCLPDDRAERRVRGHLLLLLHALRERCVAVEHGGSFRRSLHSAIAWAWAVPAVAACRIVLVVALRGSSLRGLQEEGHRVVWRARADFEV
eukprot:scaffold97061_cov54-Phaeocystis_antarctica.AAC.4